MPIWAQREPGERPKALSRPIVQAICNNIFARKDLDDGAGLGLSMEPSLATRRATHSSSGALERSEKINVQYGFRVPEETHLDAIDLRLQMSSGGRRIEYIDFTRKILQKLLSLMLRLARTTSLCPGSALPQTSSAKFQSDQGEVLRETQVQKGHCSQLSNISLP